jgi:hypothetical protein
MVAGMVVQVEPFQDSVAFIPVVIGLPPPNFNVADCGPALALPQKYAGVFTDEPLVQALPL